MTRSSLLRAASLATALTAVGPASAAATAWTGDARAAVRLITARDGAVASPLVAGLEFRFAPGWHGYWRTPGDAGVPPALDWSGTPGLSGAALDWPAPSRLVVAGLQNSVYEGQVVLPATLTFGNPDGVREIRVAVDYAACGTVCVPYHAELILPLPIGVGGASTEAPLIAAAEARVPRSPARAGITVLRQALARVGAARQLTVDLASNGAPFTHPDLFVENAGDGIPPAPTVTIGDGGRTATLMVALPGGASDAAPSTAPRDAPLALTLVDGVRSATFAGPALDIPSPRRDGDLWAALLSALAGGLILNLMPCVLPILSLKLAGVVRQAGVGRRAARLGFAATALGIVTSFLGIAVALTGLKLSGAALGWGIQFQQPWFLALLAAATLLFAASLFDWVQIGVPARLADLGGRGSRSNGTEAFLTGVFATVLATPCSAPFVGTAVGFALARGPAEILAIFLCLGLGMALPFLAAAMVPGVAGWLPRPGPWMIALRRALGLLLLGTTAWLLAVLASVAGPVATAATAVPLAGLLAVLAWLAHRPGRGVSLRWSSPAAVLLAGLAILAATVVPPSGPRPITAGDDVLAFDPATLGRLVAEGRTVLVDVSASWCLTCKVNELAALKTAAVRNRLARRGTLVMRADWSRPDPSITRYIQGFGRYGLPLDVVYGPRRPDGEALPELLTAGVVVEALDRASAAGVRAEASP